MSEPIKQIVDKWIEMMAQEEIIEFLVRRKSQVSFDLLADEAGLELAARSLVARRKQENALRCAEDILSAVTDVWMARV